MHGTEKRGRFVNRTRPFGAKTFNGTLGAVTDHLSPHLLAGGRSNEGRSLRAVLHRCLLPRGRDRDAGAAGTARLHGRISPRADLLRPTHGKQWVPGGFSYHRGAV